MFNFFNIFSNKSKKKKGEKTVEEKIKMTHNPETNNEEVSSIFAEFDAGYAALRENVARELSDYKDMLLREKKQADLYRNKVQVRDVMEELLPILSEMKNDILDADDLETVKKTITVRYKHLVQALARVGVKLQEHERNQPIEMEEKVNGIPVATVEPTLHQKIARSNKMGCVLRGEEDNPILEDVEIYVCKKAPTQNSFDTIDDYSPIKKNVPVPQTNVGDIQQESNPRDVRGFDRRCTADRSGSVQPAMKRFDVEYLGDKAIRFEKNLIVKSYTQEFPLISVGQTREFSTEWIRFAIPQDKIDRSVFTIYFGTKPIVMSNLTLADVDLVYRIFYDNSHRVCVLEIANWHTYSVTKKVLASEKLTIKQQ